MSTDTLFVLHSRCDTVQVAINAIKSASSELQIQLARLPSADDDTEAVLQVHLSCGGNKLGMQICGGVDKPYNGDTAIYIDMVRARVNANANVKCVCACVRCA